MYQLHLVAKDIATRIAPGESMILINQAQFDATIAPGRRVLSFLERHGEYWGIPQNDDVAIAEMERLRQGGARLLVFGWPAFWWLAHYQAFRDHLLASLDLVLRNDRLIIFDLARGR